MGLALVLHADARRLPLPDESVDLVVTSAPYFAQRSYRDDGQHFAGQLGSEDHPADFLEALWTVTAECWRVLKPAGSMFMNLGDKRSGSGAPGTTSGLGGKPQGTRTGMTFYAHRDRRRSTNEHMTTPYTRGAFGRAKSKMLLPHRYAIGCEDGLADPDGVGWIVRQDQVWAKVNGLPEPTTDRTHDRHEYLFHLTKQGDYFGCVDPIREPHSDNTHARRADGQLAPKDRAGLAAGVRGDGGYFAETTFHPLGRAPGSVWSIANEPLAVPDYFVDDPLLGWQALDAQHAWRLAELRRAEGIPLPVRSIEHFAAFPTELPRRIIAAWSPTGICTACGEPRRPRAVVERVEDRRGRQQRIVSTAGDDVHGVDGRGGERWRQVVSIDGEVCACSDTSAPTRPAVVLDPFGGTGTTALAAHALGRVGISVDLSLDYCRLARWRVHDPDQAAKVRRRTNEAAQLGLALGAPA